ncbi:MAG: GNAT family N-acetyltransferase [Promethearchaeota archaeon]|jgi:RimJ/RimL family protein N-acetyltransferase
MIEELMEKDFHKVKYLFEEKPFIEGLRSTLEGISIPIHVLVDNKDDPQTAVIVVFWHSNLRIWLYFGGRVDNEEFNKELRRMLYEKPILIDKEEQLVGFWVELSNTGWEEGIKFVIEDPHPDIRLYHEIKELKLKNWRDLIPEGYSVEPIDLTLMEKEHLKNDEMFNWLFYSGLRIHWFPFEEGLKDIRGFLLVKEDKEIVSFCIIGFLTEDNDIEVFGIGTKEGYRRRGFASIVGAATAEYCLPKYKSIRYICTSTNVGSYKTAEKIGYERIGEYKRARTYTNQVNSWVSNGFLHSINKVLESDPNNAHQLNWKAYLLAKFERNKDSIKIIEDLVERVPHDGNLCDTYGDILQIFHDYEEAIVKYQKALKLEPNGSFTQYSYIKMAECYKEVGNYEKTSEYAKKGREIAVERKEEEWIKRADKLLFEVKGE